MNLNLSQNEFDLIRTYIHEHCGIEVGDNKSYLVESRLAQLVVETGSKDYHEFYLKARNDPSGSLRDKIIDSITTNETLWFRDVRPWVALKEKILPEYIDQLRSGKKSKIRIWSAAASTGQELYSLLMMIDTMLAGDPTVKPEMFEVLGTDISCSALFLAITGRYNQIAMSRGLDESYKTRYFKPMGPVWVLNDLIRKRATFKKFNLQDSFASLGQFDLVFCRNVAIYFSESFKKEIFSKIAKSLTPGGYFFLGASESLSGYSTDYDMIEHKDALFYKVKRGAT